MNQKLEYDKISFSEESKNIIIAFHGWNGNRNSFKSIAKNIKIIDSIWYFPEAPYSIPGKNNKSWSYEISEGIWEVKEPKKLIHQFLNQIIFKKYMNHNIYVIGFSQGGMICYELLSELTIPISGYFPIAGFVRNKKKNPIHSSQINAKIFIGHGKSDDVISYSESNKVYQKLLDSGANVEIMPYNGRHKINLDYLKKIKEIINNG